MKTYAKINDNFSTACRRLIGEVDGFDGRIEAIKAIMIIDNMTRKNMLIISKQVSKNQADLYREEVDDILKDHDFKAFTVYYKGTNKTPVTFYITSAVTSVLCEVTQLANNMLNPEED